MLQYWVYGLQMLFNVVFDSSIKIFSFSFYAIA